MKTKQQKVAHYSVYDTRTGCRIWTAAKTQTGYGAVRWKEKHYKAHRLAWEGAYGDIEPGTVIHHKCGVRLCVNLAHLQAVTPADNQAEMLERNYYINRIRELETQIAALSNRCEPQCLCHMQNAL